MRIDTFIVDAFTDKTFSGNPAGVCLLEIKITEETMQSIASEINLSETAFLTKKKNSEQYSIRYFTPTTEIDFCGHATLASSKIIFDLFGKEYVEFETEKGLLVSAKTEGDYIKMNFPIYHLKDYKLNEKLFDAFGIVNPIEFGYCDELDMLLIEVEDKQSLLNINPDFQKALTSSETIKEVVITSKSEDKEYDFYSRCFCPWIGINEDPVTGASHSLLANYWSRKLNKCSMSAYQLSSRGGFLNLKIIDESSLEVFSNAKIVLEGKIRIE